MKALVKIALLGLVVAGVAYMAHLPPEAPPAKYGDVARAQCLIEAGKDRNSQEACVSGKLIGKWMER